jgi:hypothetical protein
MSITFDQATEVWTSMYQHILRSHRHEGEWLFVHFDQVLTDRGLDRIEAFLDARVNRSFPDPMLRRSSSDQPVPEEIRNIYMHLCKLAEHSAC